MNGHHSRYSRGQAAAVGLVVVNVGLWGLIVVDSHRQAPVRTAYVVAAVLFSTLSVGLVAAIWRSRPKVLALAVPALRHMLATHQAGHIVVAYDDDPSRLRAVTLTGRCAHHPPTVPPFTERALRTEMMIALGGTVAEELFAGESGTHAVTDLARATEIALDMAGRYAMAGSPVSLLPASKHKRDFAKRVLDDARTRKDLETVLRTAKQDTVKVMLEKRHVVVALRDALLRHNRLGPDEIRAIVVGANRRRRDDDRVLVDLRVIGNRPTAEAGQ
jgi:hypothetical protein